MSQFDPARPRYTLPFAGKDYELLGTFALIEAVEYSLKDHVGRIAVRAVEAMNFTDLAKLVSAILTSCQHPMTPKEAGDLIWNHVGLSGDENQLLRLHLYTFLSICLAPPSKREGVAKDMGEAFGKLKEASLGESTDGSSLAS